MSMNWYLIFCKPNQHLRAEEQLLNQHFTLFNPRHPVQRTIRRVTKVVDEPLFPNYLFIQLGEESNWRSLRSTRGVARVVSFNGMPAKVDEEIIEALQQQCDPAKKQAPELLFHAGDKVTITDGCFRNIEAIVKTASAEDRVVLLLKLMNTTQTIELPVGQVAPA